jgi:hypothetical protein
LKWEKKPQRCQSDLLGDMFRLMDATAAAAAAARLVVSRPIDEALENPWCF